MLHPQITLPIMIFQRYRVTPWQEKTFVPDLRTTAGGILLIGLMSNEVDVAIAITSASHCGRAFGGSLNRFLFLLRQCYR